MATSLSRRLNALYAKFGISPENTVRDITNVMFLIRSATVGSPEWLAMKLYLLESLVGEAEGGDKHSHKAAENALKQWEKYQVEGGE